MHHKVASTQLVGIRLKVAAVIATNKTKVGAAADSK